MLRKTKREQMGAEAGRLIAELEVEFDLMRFRERRTEIERQVAGLARKQELLREGLGSSRSSSSSLLARWWRALVARGGVLWLEGRRESLLELRRRYLLLEADIELSARVRGLRTGAYGRDER